MELVEDSAGLHGPSGRDGGGHAIGRTHGFGYVLIDRSQKVSGSAGLALADKSIFLNELVQQATDGRVAAAHTDVDFGRRRTVKSFSLQGLDSVKNVCRLKLALH